MKKFFTSVAAACLAVAGVNAQSWQATGDVVAENSVLVDNEYAKVATANQDGTVYTLLDSESQPTTITLGDYSFTKAVNIRVTDAPSKDSPTGTAHSAGDGTQNIALVVEAKQHTDVTLYYRIGKTKSLSVYNQTTGDSESGTQTALSEDTDNYYASNLLQLKGGNSYTIYAKGGTVQFYGLDVTAGTYTEPSAFIYANTTAADDVDGYSTMTYSDGAKVVLTGNDSKSFAGASKIKINGKDYTTTKVSNGAENTFYAPAGKKVYTFTLYSYVNKDAATARVPYWKEINGENYDETTATIMQSYKNLENPDVNTYTFKDGVESLTFTNTGEQVCFVIEADYSAVATGITSANETVSAPINKVIENGRITILRNNTKYSVAGTILK